jgi:trimeric autotransporter adhesin
MKKTKRAFNQRLNLSLAIFMLLGIISFVPVQAADLDPSILINLEATITQDGIPIAENGTIDSTKLIRVQISFGIPVLGDFDIPIDGDYVNKGDTVSFDLSNAFSLLTSSNIPLNFGSIPVGTASFVTDPITNMVTATVTFDGDDEVFDGTFNNVSAWFIADFEFDADAFTNGSGDYTITILNKDFVLNVPPLPIEYTVAKSGTVDLATQSVLWTVNLSAFQEDYGNPDITLIDITGFEFFDNLLNVGTYIANSFEVDGNPVEPSFSSNILSYVFPSGSLTPKTITFRTAISNTAYFATSTQNINNTAVLREVIEGVPTVLGQGPASVSFTPPTWITKTGVSNDSGPGVYDPTNRTITWTIDINPAGASLENVIITDVLPGNLVLNNAFWQTWDGSDWVGSNPITPNASNQYLIGNISTAVRLVIVSDVPDQLYVTNTTTYNNSASLTWDGLPVPTITTGVVPVTVGYTALSKSGVISNLLEQRMRWTINVNARGQSIPDLKVYDLLVYGTSINLSTVTGIPTGISSSDLTARFNQSYVGNFNDPAGLVTVTVIPIFQGSTRVADLLEFSNLSLSDPNTFSFDSQVLNPTIYAGNGSTNVLNTASLFSESTRLNFANATVSYVSRTLLKAMLNRSAIADPIAGVNNSTTTAANAFDYIEKTAIFRISVNADGLDLTTRIDASGNVIGTAIVTDTLPEGWEFVEILPGSSFLIFEGTGQSNRNVVANPTTPVTVVGLDSTISGRTASFTFQTLDRPYVILVKARLTEETAEQYFSTNQTITVTNSVNLRTTEWTPGATQTRNVSITSRILDKNATRPTAGELLWTINYQPYDLDQPGDRIEDQLPIGLDVRTDAMGQLIIAGNITMTEMSLNADGSYTLGASVPLILGTNISYNSTTRTLSFILAESSQAYRITYITDITGEPGSVSNTVSLISGGDQLVGTQIPYVILTADGSASLSRNGWIRINKTDGSGSPLANVEFTLFAIDNTTIIRTGRTGADGILTFRVLPDGQYILRETDVPAGYIVNDVDYSVVVNTLEGVVTSSIGGGTNLLNVQNFLDGTAGNLRVEKNVLGEGADLDKPFSFTLNLIDAPGTYAYVGVGVPDGTLSSGDRFSLAHGQSITILGIPLDASYEVIEDDYTQDGYTTTSSQAAGSIVVNETINVQFTNTFNVGNLAISKTVLGVNAESDKSFDFVVSFEGAPDVYRYIGNGVPDGTLSSGDTISLTDGQSITIIGLPTNTQYTVVEQDYLIDGYISVGDSDTGLIIVGMTQIASFTNTREVGNIQLSKTVIGEGADLFRSFIFTVIFEETDRSFVYIGEGVPSGSIRSGDTIELAHQQRITIVGLPMDLSYRIIEDDYTIDGYSRNQTEFSDEIESGTTHLAEFVNSFDLGNLTLRKLVSGNASSTSKLFRFTINFEDVDGSFFYIGNGVDDGTLSSGDVIELAHNQSITIIGLPMNTNYTIVEDDYSSDGYTRNSTNDTGVIVAGETLIVTFTNNRSIAMPLTGNFDSNQWALWALLFFSTSLIILLSLQNRLNKKLMKTGSLTLGKYSSSNNSQEFSNYQVEIDCAQKYIAYKGHQMDDGMLRNGDVVTLTQGQSITLYDLPVGVTYRIIDLDSNQDQTTLHEQGIIEADKIEPTLLTSDLV